MIRKLLPLLFLLYWCNYIHSQTLGSTQFTIDNGLPSNTIYDLVIDENGFLWIATDYGISKFDGSTFKNYTVSDGLIGNEILQLKKDSKNRIWMAAFNGKVGYIENGILHNELNMPLLKKLNFTNFVRDIFEDSQGNLFFCKKKVLKKLDINNNIEVIKISNNLKNFGFLLLEDHKKNLIMTSYTSREEPKLITKNINQPNSNWIDFNPENFPNKSITRIKNNFGLQLRFYNDTIANISKNYIHQSNNYLAKMYDYKENILVTNLISGVHFFKNSNFNSEPTIILPNVRTTRAFVDNEANIWIGTYSNGLYFIPNLNVTGIKFPSQKKNSFYSIQYFNNQIVAGNENNELLLLNPENLKVEKTLKTSLTPERVRKIKNHNNKLYILSDDNIHVYDSLQSFKKIKNIYNFDFHDSNLFNFKDLTFSNGSIITANSNGVSKIDLVKKSVERIWNTRSTSICQTSKDSLFIGTTTGLYLYTNNKIEKYNLGVKFNNSIIYSLVESPYGLLIGSNSFGLGLLNNGEFNSYSTSDGLLSNYIKSIYVCNGKRIWLATNLGLNKIHLGKNNTIVSIKSYTISDGLFSNDVRDCIITNSKVYVATSKGVNVIDLSKEENSKLSPIIQLNKVLVNNIPINKNKSQIFDYTQNNFEFDFSGISFKSLGNIHYKYKLKGLEKNWVETKNNTVRYAELPDGEYTFEAYSIAKNIEQSKNNISFSFRITPPFHKTWWFAILMIGFLLVTLYLYFNQRAIRIKKENEIKENISNLRYKALNSQMSPHFINNLIVNINNSMTRDNYKTVEKGIHNFGKLVNLVLKSTKLNLISLEDELNMVNSYIELEKLRFSNLNYKLNTSTLSKEDLEFTLVPPMIIQPIVENSIKHGFTDKEKLNEISLHIYIEKDDYLICEITDNGQGIKEKLDQRKSKGISIQNIQERLELVSDNAKKEQFIITENVYDEFSKLAHVKVTIKIPLLTI